MTAKPSQPLDLAQFEDTPATISPKWLALLAECRRQRSQVKALREAASAVAAMLGDTPRDRLGRLDIVATLYIYLTNPSR